MFKVIVTLTAAASSMIGQLCVETEPVGKPETIKKEIINPIEPKAVKPEAVKKTNNDTKLA